jgi:hypothetical protein
MNSVVFWIGVFLGPALLSFLGVFANVLEGGQWAGYGLLLVLAALQFGGYRWESVLSDRFRVLPYVRSAELVTAFVSGVIASVFSIVCVSYAMELLNVLVPAPAKDAPQKQQLRDGLWWSFVVLGGTFCASFYASAALLRLLIGLTVESIAKDWNEASDH